MILSFVVATFEYKKVHEKYEKAISKAKDDIKKDNNGGENDIVYSAAWWNQMYEITQSITYKDINNWSN